MSDPTNHWKLGLFVVAGTFLAIAVMLYLSTQTWREQTVGYTSYFDESVTGLDVGSAVKFRGVTIGNVSDIDVAPDRRHVEVHYNLAISALDRLGLAASDGKGTKMRGPAELRAEIGSRGVTGVKYLLIDVCVTAHCPVEQLPFPVPENHIPSQPSALKNIEDSVMQAADEFPALAEQMRQTLVMLQTVLQHLDDARLPEKVSGTLEGANRTLAVLQTTLHDLQAKKLSQDARQTLAGFDATLRKTQSALARIDGEHGLLASIQRMSDSMGDIASNARRANPDLADTLREVHDAAASMREFLDTLELDPDMLVKGRARGER